jgi:hypothetical protein
MLHSDSRLAGTRPGEDRVTIPLVYEQVLPLQPLGLTLSSLGGKGASDRHKDVIQEAGPTTLWTSR